MFENWSREVAKRHAATRGITAETLKGGAIHVGDDAGAAERPAVCFAAFRASYFVSSMSAPIVC